MWSQLGGSGLRLGAAAPGNQLLRRDGAFPGPVEAQGGTGQMPGDVTRCPPSESGLGRAGSGSLSDHIGETYTD